MENLEKIKEKKFLIIGSGHKLSLEKSYIRAFKNLKIKNIDYLFLDTGKLESFFNKHSFFDGFLSKVVEKKINLKLTKSKFDYIIVFKGMQLSYSFLKNLKKIQNKTKFINIYTDNPFNLSSKTNSNLNVIRTIKLYDYFCISFNRTLNKRLKKFGAKKIVFLPFGKDIVKNNITKLVNEKKIINKINFVGSFDKHREKFLNDLNFNIDVFGPGWKKKHNLNGKLNIYPRTIDGMKLKRIISKYAISLNILRKQDRNSHNMKTFEIPAMAGLLLTNRTKEQNFFFRENKDCFMYKDIKELKKKIFFIINNKKKADRVRKNGFTKSKRHSYENRLKYLLSVVK